MPKKDKTKSSVNDLDKLTDALDAHSKLSHVQELIKQSGIYGHMADTLICLRSGDVKKSDDMLSAILLEFYMVNFNNSSIENTDEYKKLKFFIDPIKNKIKLLVGK